MREPAMTKIQKDELLKKAFDFFVDSGLENITVREFAKTTGIGISSAYYWFGDKDRAILSATEWGFNYVAEKIFGYVFQYIDNPQYAIAHFAEFAMQYREQMRFISQVATSRNYGDAIRPLAAKLPVVYDKYTEMVANRYGCDKNELRPYVYLFISSIWSYIIWNNSKKMETELSCIYKLAEELLKE